MKILSLNWTLNSSAALIDSGKIVAAAAEERFSRVKNEVRFPTSVLNWIKQTQNLDFSKLTAVAIPSMDCPPDNIIFRKCDWKIDDYLKEQKEYWNKRIYDNANLDIFFDVFPDKLHPNQYPAQYWQDCIAKRSFASFSKDFSSLVASALEVDEKLIHRIDHHRCHAGYSYFGSPMRGKKVLAFTVDGWGDGVNATISIFDEAGQYERVYSSTQCNIARIYRYMTLLLGMKPNEHEYKLMGLAPYAKPEHAKRALDVFKDTLYVDGFDFKWHTKPTDSYEWFRKRLEGVRFDSLAWALQTWVEDLLVQWVDNAVKHFGISDVVMSGGVAMNIKAMGCVADLPSVKKFFVAGTPNDDSLAIAGAMCLYQDLSVASNQSWTSTGIKPLDHLYLGPTSEKKEEEQVAKIAADQGLRIVAEPTSAQVAKLLSQGKVIARCAGAMEFGQRSLGNRSILADPQNSDVRDQINKIIKCRDFWMPFAPILMEKFADEYLVNPKHLESPHMTIGFQTTEKGYEAMKAACHPSDHSARPQILAQAVNPKMYELLEEFSKITGRGALLNTSFNLHGYPIVNTAAEAYEVLQKSGLDGILLNHYLIVKPNVLLPDA